MSNKTPSPATILRRAINRMLRKMRVALPGVVQDYDASTCTATVQLSCSDVDQTEDGTVAALAIPPCNHVPVFFQGGGGSRLTFPVKRGDECLVIFASSSVDKVLAFGGPQDPGSDARHHHLSDAVCCLVYGVSRANVKAANGSATVLEGSDVRLGDASAQALMTVADGQQLLNALATAAIALGANGAAAVATAANTAAGGSWPKGTTKVKAT